MAIDNQEKLQEILKKMTQEINGPGDYILYDMCRKWKKPQEEPAAKWNEERLLGDAMVLISRAYAASPERRFTWKEKTSEDTKKKLGTAGDGTGYFFYEVAGRLLKQDGYKALKKFENHAGYAFDGSEKDMQLLKETISAVAKFNETLKTVIEDYDRVNNSEDVFKQMIFRNHISFCSKFLHFNYPDLFFIIDSFSQAAGSWLFPTRATTNVTIRYGEDAVEIQNKGIAKKEKGLNGVLSQTVISAVDAAYEDDEDGRMKDSDDITICGYKEHCFRAYKTAALVRQMTMYQPKDKYDCAYPRIADRVLMSTKK